ncbi:hypothetical protein RRG08_060905 [Elysia crispata]|uniref:Uncharacterized protein n=1 Tax=Elysia crispata TaxID=231223 RepID=A0AAE0Z2C5_9GAST|nr:hypothetical protein RRG08_060905 [Elysia crispata]
MRTPLPPLVFTHNISYCSRTILTELHTGPSMAMLEKFPENPSSSPQPQPPPQLVTADLDPHFYAIHSATEWTCFHKWISHVILTILECCRSFHTPTGKPHHSAPCAEVLARAARTGPQGLTHQGLPGSR